MYGHNSLNSRLWSQGTESLEAEPLFLDSSGTGECAGPLRIRSVLEVTVGP